MASERLPVWTGSRMLEVSEAGYYDWRSRPPSARPIRRVWLTETIQAVHARSRGIYGSPRILAELQLGHSLVVGMARSRC